MITNEEWLKSLPTEEFAKYLAANDCSFCVGGCIVRNMTCFIGTTEWLKQEHKNEK